MRATRARNEQDSAGFDSLLTDIVMPGMTGLQLASTVRGLKGDQAILLMSGYNQDLLAPGEERDVPLLTKPFTADALLAAVEEAARRSVATSPAPATASRVPAVPLS